MLNDVILFMFLLLIIFWRHIIMDYTIFDKNVKTLDGKIDGCSTKDGEFRATCVVNDKFANDELAKSLHWIFLSSANGKTSYRKCSMITDLDVETFHNGLSLDEQKSAIRGYHVVKYQELQKNELWNALGSKTSVTQDKIRKEAVKIIVDIKANFIKTLTELGMSKKDAEKKYQEMRDDANI